MFTSPRRGVVSGTFVNMFGAIILLLLIFVISFLFIFCILGIRHYGYWKQRGIPYEKPSLLFGNLTFVMRKSNWDFFFDIQKKYKECDYIGIFLAYKPTLLIQSNDLAKQILVKDSANFIDRHVFTSLKKDPLGALNLFVLKSPLWNQLRSELSPMFTSTRLKSMTKLVNINSADLVDRIRSDHVEDHKTVNLKELFSMYTSDAIGYTVFGLRVSVLNDLTSPIWNITQHMVKWTFWRGLEFIIIIFAPNLGKLFNISFFSKTASENVKKIFIDVVEERKQTNTICDNDLVTQLMKLKDRLKLPTSLKQELAEDLMYAQAAVFMFASIETTSTTLTNCLHELAHHPEQQGKLYEEITKARRATGKDILEYSDLLELKYLTACILETLRKHPVTAYLERHCSNTYKLNEEVTIEAGTPVYINVMALHYNEEYYPEPEKWRPERFINATENSNNDYTFLPFGEGPRVCIGKRLAMLQIRAAIAHMVPCFKFGPVEPYVLETDPYSVLLSPKCGGHVHFIPR